MDKYWLLWVLCELLCEPQSLLISKVYVVVLILKAYGKADLGKEITRSSKDSTTLCLVLARNER